MLLRVFDAVDQKALTTEQQFEVLRILESFLIRRSVCGYPSHQLRTILPPIFDAIGGAGELFVPGVREQLGGKRCPDDNQFFEALLTQPLYANAMRGTRLRIMLERIEESFDHKEQVDFVDSKNIQIEHIMPQTLTSDWIDELGEGAQDLHSRLLHTLGNLTLTGYNPELSNQPYREKKEVLKDSHFELNRYFDKIDRWTPAEIKKRAKSLANRALQIWPDLGRIGLAIKDADEGSQKPVAVRFQGQTQAIKTWRAGTVKLLEMLETANPGILANLVAKGVLATELTADPHKFPRSKTIVGGVYVNTHASVQELKRRLRRIAEQAGVKESDYEFILPDIPGSNA
jgi:hypothetical protein